MERQPSMPIDSCRPGKSAPASMAVFKGASGAVGSPRDQGRARGGRRARGSERAGALGGGARGMGARARTSVPKALRWSVNGGYRGDAVLAAVRADANRSCRGRHEAHLAAEVCWSRVFSERRAPLNIKVDRGGLGAFCPSTGSIPRICARAAREQLSPTRARAPNNSRAAEQVFHEQRVAARAEAQKKRAGWPRRRGCVARR